MTEAISIKSTLKFIFSYSTLVLYLSFCIVFYSHILLWQSNRRGWSPIHYIFYNIFTHRLSLLNIYTYLRLYDVIRL